MIEPKHELPNVRHTDLVNIRRGSIYYLPASTIAADLTLVWCIDGLHLEFPFAGARILRDIFTREGLDLGWQHTATP
jgi:putative transposase